MPLFPPPPRVLETFLLGLLFSTRALANPEGATVVSGDVAISSSGQRMDINQSTEKAIINWNSFNVEALESVHFNQPGASSVTLNRVVGADPSQIMGAINAPGTIFLLNPNGIVFGYAANVHVGSLVASTLDMSDEDFLQGRHRLVQDFDRDLAAIVNRGLLQTRGSGGKIALVAPLVDNQMGQIMAQDGEVLIRAGTQANLDSPETVDPSVPTASGRSVRIVEAFFGPDLEQLVNTTSVAPANKVERLGDGTVYLRGAGGIVHNSGKTKFLNSYGNEVLARRVEVHADHAIGFSGFHSQILAQQAIGEVFFQADTGNIQSRSLTVEADQVTFRTPGSVIVEEGSRFELITRVTNREEGGSLPVVAFVDTPHRPRASALRNLTEEPDYGTYIAEGGPEPELAPELPEPVLLSGPTLEEPVLISGPVFAPQPAAPDPGPAPVTAVSDPVFAPEQSSGAAGSNGSTVIGSSSDDPGASDQQPLRTLGDRDNVLLPASRDSAARRPTDQSSTTTRASRQRHVTEITGPRTSTSSTAGGLIRFENRTQVRRQNIDEVVSRPQNTGRSRDSARLERRDRRDRDRN